MPARSLHQQVLLGRKIVPCEQADLHLVWSDKTLEIFIKPLPLFLLHHGFWETHISSDNTLHRLSCGFLLSYIWLIRHKCDLRIAKEVGIMPPEIEFEAWYDFTSMFLKGININTPEQQTDRRFCYGELRLGRLNAIYRFAPRFGLRYLMRGYRAGYANYSSFFIRNFAWLIGAFAYTTVVLSAFQVGLGTERLQGDRRFERAAYGFSIFSIMLPVIAIGLAVVLFLVIFLYHLFATIQYRKKAERRRITWRQTWEALHRENP